jgi:uncharacterized membrane protein YdjX (TVP38/TMEM64 family)
MNSSANETVARMFMTTNFRKLLTGPALLGLVLSALPLLMSSYITYYAVTHEAQIALFSATDWVIATVVCSLACAFALMLPTPLALIFGYFLSWNAVAPLFIINMSAIVLVNIVVQQLDQDRVRRLIEQNPKAARVLHRIRERELQFIFFAKLSPALPFSLTNMVFSLSGASLRNILLGGFLGMVPRTLLAIWSGAQAHHIRTLLDNPNEGSHTQIIVIALLVVSMVGLISVVSKAMAK